MTIQELINEATSGEYCEDCVEGVGRTKAKEIGRILRKARGSLKLKLKPLAEALGKPTQYVSDMEHGRRIWTLDLLIGYLEFLDDNTEKQALDSSYL